ncbi:hypothetical protein MMC32_004696 [Xylographa parallela]|nr:hypothetical protein [Xylographa parallela]
MAEITELPERKDFGGGREHADERSSPPPGVLSRDGPLSLSERGFLTLTLQEMAEALSRLVNSKGTSDNNPQEITGRFAEELRATTIHRLHVRD